MIFWCFTQNKWTSSFEFNRANEKFTNVNRFSTVISSAISDLFKPTKWWLFSFYWFVPKLKVIVRFSAIGHTNRNKNTILLNKCFRNKLISRLGYKEIFPDPTKEPKLLWKQKGHSKWRTCGRSYLVMFATRPFTVSMLLYPQRDSWNPNDQYGGKNVRPMAWKRTRHV